MKTRVVDASERFDATHFDPRTEHLQHEICVSNYTCPSCSYRVRFNTHDFGSSRRDDPFTPEQRSALDAARPLDVKTWEQCFEFLCPQCSLPVRAVYHADHEFAMGCHTYELLAVADIVSDGK